MTINEKRELRKQELINVMLEYKDEYGNIDLTRLRKENDRAYNKLSYNFGSIDNALIAAGGNTESSTESAKGAPVNRKTLRNELAYDMLVYLRSKHTLEEIAQQYGCSRAYVNQLFQSLEQSVGAVREAEEQKEVN